MLSNLSILVTGGAGFIGGHIVDRLLLLQVKKVKVLDNLSTGNIDFIHNLQSKYCNLEFIQGDVTDLETVRKALQGCDKVCHHASLISVPESIDNPLIYHNINDTGFLNIILASNELGIKRIVYASSAAVYGNTFQLPLKENYIGTCQSPYGLNKRINELYANLFSELYEMECIGLRYFNVFGPRQNTNNSYSGVISKFIDLISKNKSPIIYGKGEQTRDFVYVDNIVNANILALTTSNTKTYGQVFNIGTNYQTSILKLFELINHIFKKNIKPIFMKSRKGDIEHSYADITKAKTLLNYHPDINLKQGLLYLLHQNIETL
jgi:nucleoside-diphosphate-sugar epimerase